MKYSYTNEDAVTATVDISLWDLDSMLNILEPVTQDLEHKMRHRASDLHANLLDIRKQMVESAIESLKYKADRFDK